MKHFHAMYRLLSVEHKRRFAFVLLVSTILGCVEASTVVMIFLFFSVAAGDISPILYRAFETFGLLAYATNITAVGLAVAAFLVFRAAFSLWSYWYQNRYISFSRHSLSVRLLEAIVRQPYAYFLSANTETLRARFLTDVDKIMDSYLRGVLTLFSEAIVSLMILGVLLIQNTIVTTAALAFLSLIGLILHMTLRTASTASSHELTTHHHARYRIGGAMMAGVKDLKAASSEGYFFSAFEKASSAFSKVHLKQHVILVSPKLVMETSAFLILISATMVFAVSNSDMSTFLPLIALYGAAAHRLLPSVVKMLSGLQQIRFASEPLEGVTEIFQTMSIGGRPDFEIDDLSFKDKIECLDINYQYPSGHDQALTNITVTIHKDSFIGVVGPSGSGKSTFIEVLLGLLMPQQGTLRVDGQKITEGNAPAWRKNVGFVPQQIFLFDASLAENIAFGFGSEIDMCEVRRVAKLAQLDTFISSLPDGYSTLAGENGVRLSGGQRQRLGIARALYGGPDLILFDEATSALDNETEKAVTDAISSLAGTVTMVVVAHRLSSVMSADKLLLMADGKVASFGSYDELLDESDLFRRLVMGV